MKSLLDKTKDLKSESLVNAQQYKLGSTGLSAGRKFILYPGKQLSDKFQSGTRTVTVFKYKALMLTPDNQPVCIDGVNLSDLCRNTYGKITYNESGERKAYPEIGFTVSSKGNSIPETFGEELNCGWDVRKQFIKKDGDNTLYDGMIDYPQAFVVDRVEFHWVSDFDSINWSTKRDSNGNVAMKPKLVAIVKRIDIDDTLQKLVDEYMK